MAKTPATKAPAAKTTTAKTTAAKTTAAKAPAAKATKKAGATPRTDGIHKPVTPSADLGAIVGTDAQPRSGIVSKMWEYIKKHDLQDSKDRRQINADAKLEKIFGKKSVSMFEMNKHISSHVK